MWRLLAGYLIPATVYFAARRAPLTERGWAQVSWIFIGLGIYLAITGILEINHQWSLVFPKHIADPKVGIHYGRARGPMATAVSYGMYLCACAVAAAAYLPQRGKRGRILLAVVLPLMLLGIYLSYTRSVWIGAGLGLTIVFGMALQGRLRMLFLSGIVAGGALLGVTKMDSILEFKRESSAAETLDSSKMRASFAYVSWKMFQDQPLFGVGFGHFRESKLPYLSDKSTPLVLESIRDLVHHNTYLSLLTETGAVGLGIFLAMLASWIADALRVWRDPQSEPWQRSYVLLLLGTMGAHSAQLLFHELSYGPRDNALVFFLAGICVQMRANADSRSPAPETVSWSQRLRHLQTRLQWSHS